MITQKLARPLQLCGILVLILAGIPRLSAYALDNQGTTQILCYYDGKPYSEGAKVILGNGTVQTCNKDGSWSRKSPNTDQKPVNPINIGGVLK